MSMQWLFDLIEDRKQNPSEKSYTASLFRHGLPRIAQKVGEEGIEVVVAALALPGFDVPRCRPSTPRPRSRDLQNHPERRNRSRAPKSAPASANAPAA